VATKKPTKTQLLPLSELYERKITATVEAAIHQKEDFSKIAPAFCENVCQIANKTPHKVILLNEDVDILIVQDYAALPGQYDRYPGQQERIMRDIIHAIGQEAGFAGLQVKVVDLLKCGVTQGDFKKGAAPTSTVVQKCRPYLWGEIERCKPKVIISLSTSVTKALGHKTYSNTGNRGEIIDNQVVITLHPKVLTMIRQNASGALWGQELYEVIRRDFQKAADLARGILRVPNREESIAKLRAERMVFATSLEDVQQIVDTINALPENAVVSWDTETTGLDPHHVDAKLILVQFGWRDPVDRVVKAGIIPMWHRDNDLFDPDLAWAMIHPILTGPRTLAGHNGKFDILYTYFTTGVRVRNYVFDTMLMMHTLDSGTQGCYSLKTAVWDFIPQMGFGGYEESLPRLTKITAMESENDPETEENSAEEESGEGGDSNSDGDDRDTDEGDEAED